MSEVGNVERFMTQLLEITAELAQARTREQLVAATLGRAASSVGARAVSVWSRAPGSDDLELLASTHLEAAGPYQRVSLASDTPLAVVARSGEACFMGSRAEFAARFPTSWSRVEALMPAHPQSFALVPLVAGSALIGALAFTYAGEREFDDATRAYKTLLARHFALALTRIQLHDDEAAQREAAVRAAAAEKQARGDIELLYELIASFNRLDDIEHVYRLALESVCGVSRSDRAAILLYDASKVMRFRAWLGLSDTYRAAVDGHSPWRSDDPYPRPVIVDDAQHDRAWEPYWPTFAAEGIGSLAFVPIVHQRKLIGKFMLYRNEARAFAPRDIQLAATVAVHVAQGIERKQHECELARAYREEREAHLLAEEAARAREEILSVVSHDLRNPLGAMMMGAATLQSVPDGDNTRVRMTAQRIHRQAERMARLIEDLVDFAGIQAGRLELERRRHPPHMILATTRDIYGPIASERGLRLEAEIQHGLPHVDCDGDRVIQILSNLVSNALKVTPKGGQIAIGAQPKRDEIVFYVRDTGPGIEPDDLPTLFERHWRAKQGAYRVTSLGLSIARGIVDAHGGRIWAESQLGAGSTFYFSLTPSS
jgi:signal transduction histidine kinase